MIYNIQFKIEEHYCNLCDEPIKIPLGTHIQLEHEDLARRLLHVNLSEIKDDDLRKRLKIIGIIV